MIIQCKSCSRRFIAKDSDIPKEGRMVQCGYCSVTWHQMPVSAPTKVLRQKNINEPTKEIDEYRWIHFSFFSLLDLHKIHSIYIMQS